MTPALARLRAKLPEKAAAVLDAYVRRYGSGPVQSALAFDRDIAATTLRRRIILAFYEAGGLSFNRLADLLDSDNRGIHRIVISGRRRRAMRGTRRAA